MLKEIGKYAEKFGWWLNDLSEFTKVSIVSIIAIVSVIYGLVAIIFWLRDSNIERREHLTERNIEDCRKYSQFIGGEAYYTSNHFHRDCVVRMSNGDIISKP